MLRFNRLSIMGLSSIAAFAASAEGATIFVAPCGNNGWTGANVVCVAPLGPKRTIQAAINAANPGDFVHVLPGTYNERIDLNGKAITLLGTAGAASTIIDGGDGGTVVTLNSLEGPSTVVRGFTIRNGNAPKGGGMLIALSSPTIEECIIRENFADNLGAGVACVAASPTFTDCQFNANEADVGGADSDGHGAGVSIEGSSPEFVGCTFYGNGANDAGGGAAVYNNASPTFTDCTFENNSQWTYCVAEPCNPPKAGSAVLSIGSSPSFEGCTFHQNHTGGHGAVMVSGGSAEFITCDFTENWSVFTPDPAQHGGALAGQAGADLTLVGCSFTDNQSNNSAGAIYLRDSSLSATLCGFSGNIANKGRGGAIEAIESTVAISACTMFQNLSRDGGGAFTVSGGSMGVSSSTFSQNETGADAVPAGGEIVYAAGGAIEAEEGFVEVTSCTFIGNESYHQGGAVAYDNNSTEFPTDLLDADIVVQNCTFEANDSHFGGALYVDNGVGHISDSMFEANNATFANSGGVGGGLSIGHYGYARIDDSEFLNNSAAHFGGAIGVYGKLDAIGCLMSDNSADEGGGVYAYSNNTRASLYSCRLTRNTAIEDGSATYVASAAEMNLMNCVIDRNTAPENSAAVVSGGAGVSNPPLRVTNCTIHLNSGGGGVISKDAAFLVYVTNSIVWGHTGPEVGIFQGGVEYSDIQGGHAGEGNIDALPLWVGPLGGNYHLMATSPCIDAGRTTALPQDQPDLDTDLNMIELVPQDYDGAPRVTDVVAMANTGCGPNGVVDIGAFEAAGVVAPPTMPGDANGDGSVNFADITEVLTNWGFCPGSCCLSDVDYDGEVDFADITEVLTYWGLVG